MEVARQTTNIIDIASVYKRDIPGILESRRGVEEDGPAELNDVERNGYATAPTIEHNNMLTNKNPAEQEGAEKMENDKLFDVLREDRAESETRLERQMSALEERLTRQNEKTEERIQLAVNGIERKLDALENTINASVKEIHETSRSVNGITTATIIGIAALAVTIILATIFK